MKDKNGNIIKEASKKLYKKINGEIDEMKHEALMDQLKELNTTMQHISDNIGILSWQNDKVLKEKGIILLENEDMGAIEMD